MTRSPGHAAAVVLAAAALSCAPDQAGAPAPPASAAPAAASSPPAAPSWTALDPPAGPGALAPQLTTVGNDPLLTWLERDGLAGPSGAAPGAAGHRLRLARLAGGRWSEPVTVTAGTDFFANWADVPAVAAAPEAGWLAAWLAKTGAGTYDYSIRLARSGDGGATWRPAGLLHEPGPGEHGFMAFVPEEGGLRAFFLQGTEEKGTTLRTALVPAGEGAAGPAEVLDPLACDCCPLSAALTSEGPVVAYRDRSPDEIRDVHLIRRTAAGWSRPVPVGGDGWRIPGCPVNGPSVAAAGRQVVVAWFTAAPPGPRVHVAFSRDAGATFGPTVTVDAGVPLGRVSLVLDGSTAPPDAIVGWLAHDSGESRAAVTLRRIAPSGAMGAPLAVGETSSARSSGIPRLARTGDRLVLVWIEDGKLARLRASSLPLAAVPAVPRSGS